MVERWRYTDHHTGEVWTVPINPDRMTSPFPEKAVTTRHTTAVDGQHLLFEGAAPPAQWTFSGNILDHAHYAELKRWVEKRNRITIRDHFGRVLYVYLTKFDPEPKRAIGRYWRHTYTVTALVFSVSEPTVGV